VELPKLEEEEPAEPTIDVDEYKANGTAPTQEGKVFSGWATLTQEGGQSVYQLVFQPDETGHVAIPEGTILEPLTLYAVFEDAGAAAESAAEGA